MTTRLTLLEVCNALFKLRKWAPIATLRIDATWKDLCKSMKRAQIRAVVVQSTVYCVIKMSSVSIVSSYGPVYHFRSSSRHVPCATLSQETMCLIAFLFYMNELSYLKLDSLDLHKGWQLKLSQPALNLMQNTPNCSQLTVKDDGYLFQNNYHQSYHPIKMRLLNGHRVRVRLPFSRMNWLEVLHYLTKPDVVQDIYSQISGMEIGYLGFVLKDCGVEIGRYGFTDNLQSENTRIWYDPQQELETFLPSTLCLIIWSYVFEQGKHHRDISNRVKRSKHRSSEWARPVKLIACPMSLLQEDIDITGLTFFEYMYR